MGWGIYLLKVAAVQAIALLAYQLLLDKEPLGHFKRAYLLLSLSLAFIIPTIVIWTANMPESGLEQMVYPNRFSGYTGMINQPYRAFDWQSIIWAVYLIGAATASFKILKELWQIIKNYQSSHERINKYDAIWVALNNPTRTHSFGRFIFYTRGEFPSDAIVRHELAHVRQWHTLDRLAIKLLRVIWWFNPLLLLYERAIRHNHELLADRAVVASGDISVTEYLQELLAQLNPLATSPPIANHLPFQFTKKRFQMISRSIHTGHAFAKGALLFFCWIVLLIGFGQTAFSQDFSSIRFPKTYEITEADQKALDNQLTVAEWRKLSHEEIFGHLPKDRGVPFFPPQKRDSTILFIDFRINQLKSIINRSPIRKPMPPSEEEFTDWQNTDKWLLRVNDELIPNDQLTTILDREDIFSTVFHYMPSIKYDQIVNDRKGTAIITTLEYRDYRLERARETLAYLESIRE